MPDLTGATNNLRGTYGLAFCSPDGETMVQRSAWTYPRSPSKCLVLSTIMLRAGTGSLSLSSAFCGVPLGTTHRWLGIAGNHPMGIYHLFATGREAS